jgi:uncharacterized OsmC-like protein
MHERLRGGGIMSDTGFAVELERVDDYRFTVEFDQEGVSALQVDEPAPLGAGTGPNATRLLAAAVGNCLSASLLFCLTRSRVVVQGMRTKVEGTIVRNERGRLRVGKLIVKLEAGVAPGDAERMGRCLELFEDFCTVGRSVGEGIPIEVTVSTVPAVAASGDTADPV